MERWKGHVAFHRSIVICRESNLLLNNLFDTLSLLFLFF